MKLENCGRCGLEPVEVMGPLLGQCYGEAIYKGKGSACPVHGGGGLEPAAWNAAQFAARTERINAAVVAIAAMADEGADFKTCVLDAEELIEMEDARTRARWAEMQKGGE